MENKVINRLSNIKIKIENLANERKTLLSKLEEQALEITNLKVELVQKQQKIDNFKNNGKEESIISGVSKSTQQASHQTSEQNDNSSTSNEQIKQEIDGVIAEIDQCIKIISDKT